MIEQQKEEPMLKKLIFTSITLSALLLSACGSDYRYKREVDGNEDYLNTPKLQNLVVPADIKLPTPTSEYHVYTATAKGEVGKNLDIRTPLLPLATLSGSEVKYYDGAVSLDAPMDYLFWPDVTTILQTKNVPVLSSSSKKIITGSYLIFLDEEEGAYDATYSIEYSKNNRNQSMHVELLSLRRNGQDVTSSIEKQRYAVWFFNTIMIELKKREIAVLGA